jgi:hypothetical protein
MPKFLARRLSRLSEWGAPLLEAATQKGPYPRWLIGSIKATTVIGLLTVAAAWTMERSAKAQLAQLVQEASKPKPERGKPINSRQR